MLRHGESEWNKENRSTGWTDVPLSEKGLLEARSAGNVLKEKGFSLLTKHIHLFSKEP
ncbi:MAG: histidine phosphatase family protein [Synergistaceae bacterium]|nr:histidine phosphatase family protein [Synergistaceae bacterium]